MKKNDFIKKTLDFSKKLNINLIKKIVVFDEISSTNNEAKKLALNGEDEGTIVISRIQNKGRGRFDRIWESPNGGVYLSIILRPKCNPEKAMLLSLLAAIIISKTISSYNLVPKIKWPNDVRVSGKKIAGVLIESEAYDKRIKYVIIGLGVNLNIDSHNFSKTIRSNSTSLSQEIGKTIDYFSFVKKLLNNIDKYYKIFSSKRYGYIINEWKNQSDTIGRRVKINTTSGEFLGDVIDINQSGFLEVVLDSGKHLTLSSDECIYLNK